MNNRDAILKYFEYSHLPHHLQLVSEPFFQLASNLLHNVNVTDERELAVALRKLLEAKDAAVRSVLP
jgi:hypothetical protein